MRVFGGIAGVCDCCSCLGICVQLTKMTSSFHALRLPALSTKGVAKEVECLCCTLSSNTWRCSAELHTCVCRQCYWDFCRARTHECFCDFCPDSDLSLICRSREHKVEPGSQYWPLCDLVLLVFVLVVTCWALLVLEAWGNVLGLTKSSFFKSTLHSVLLALFPPPQPSKTVLKILRCKALAEENEKMFRDCLNLKVVQL